MKQLSQPRQFAKDVKRLRRRGRDIEKLKAVNDYRLREARCFRIDTVWTGSL